MNNTKSLSEEVFKNKSNIRSILEKDDENTGIQSLLNKGIIKEVPFDYKPLKNSEVKEVLLAPPNEDNIEQYIIKINYENLND
jgi:hypothetical protein